MSPGAQGTGPDDRDSSGVPGRDGRAARLAVFDMVGTTVESGDEVYAHHWFEKRLGR